jgi:hypothetical protein
MFVCKQAVEVCNNTGFKECFNFCYCEVLVILDIP